MWNYFDSTVRGLGFIPGFEGLDLPALLDRAFPGLRIVLLTRRDRVRQAVSWARASQDGVWVVSEEKPNRPESTPSYDFVLISNLEKLIVEGERGWRSLCDRLGIVPIEVVYEDLADDVDATVRMIANELGLRPANKSRFHPRTKQRAGPINEEWTERYRRG